MKTRLIHLPHNGSPLFSVPELEHILGRGHAIRNPPIPKGLRPPAQAWSERLNPRPNEPQKAAQPTHNFAGADRNPFYTKRVKLREFLTVEFAGQVSRKLTSVPDFRQITSQKALGLIL
jgi:hypothetical protein